jgi:uncharacterized membrane protein YqaE (UPF0057 family)
MKKLISFLAVAILFSSCGNKMTLMKRHYTKGFYVHHALAAQKPKEHAMKAQTGALEIIPKDVLTGNKRGLPEPVLTASIEHNAPPVTKKLQPAQARAGASALRAPREPFRYPVLSEKKNGLAKGERGSGGDVNLVILVILAIFIPPLAVFLKAGEVNKWFWITLILWLLSFSAFVFVFGGLGWLIAMIIALLYVFDKLS